MARLTFEELASTLGIKKKVLSADIRDLAWVWEETVEDMELHDPLAAFDVVSSIAKAYIRGRNCRMGSYQTLWKHLPTKAAVIYWLTVYVCEENREYTHFPRLRNCGVVSEEFIWHCSKLTNNRWLKREEEEKREKEEAKGRAEQKKHDLIQKLLRQKRYNILDEVRRIMDGF